MINSDYLDLGSIFHPPCPSDQCGDRSLAIATATPEARYLRKTEEHKHEGYLLFLPLQTDKNLKIAGKVESIPAGDLAVVPPDIEHSVLQVKGSPAYLALHMNKDLLEGEYAFYEMSDGLLEEFSVLSGDHDELLNLAYRFMTEIRNDLPGKDSVKSALTLQMVHAVIRKLSHLEVNPDSLSSDHLGLRRALIFLEANLQNRLSVEQLAREANMSESTLTRWFKRELDATPADYLLRARLLKAERLLRNSKQAVSDIAFSCGFGSVAYFSTRFKRQYGCTPSVFRKGRERY